MHTRNVYVMTDMLLTKRQRLVLTDMACGALMSVGGMLFENHTKLYNAKNDVFIALRDAKYIRVNADGMYEITSAGRKAIGQLP